MRARFLLALPPASATRTLAITAALPDISGDKLDIYLEPHRAIVHGQRTSEQQGGSSGTQNFSQEDFFLRSDRNVEVDPSTASATLKDQKLTIMVKKRYPADIPSTALGQTSE